MAELADALDLGSSGATRTGSIPASRTRVTTHRSSFSFIFYILLIRIYFDKC